MSEYKLISENDKVNCLLEHVSGEKYYIKCSDLAQANDIKLSLLLETMASPSQAPELYIQEINNNEIFYTPKLVAFRDQSEDEEALNCCQSGCSGCPYFKGYKDN